jgi:putative hemolysin
MNNSLKIILLAGLVILIGLLLLNVTGMITLLPIRSSTGSATEPTQAGLANPASVHCQDQGYTLEIHTAEDGGQYGVCVFPDGSQCDEWAFYRGECGPGSGE